jgi:hypothetical protein
MANMTNSPWTDELRSEVKGMWANHSAQEIAVALQERGYNFTRNSIVGLLHRMGLTMEQKAEARKRRPPAPKRKREQKPVLRIVSAGYGSGMRITSSVTSDLPLFECVDLPPLNKTLAELGPNDCRYIAGDPLAGALYCGHQVHQRSYCAAHFSRCYVEPQKRWRAAA